MPITLAIQKNNFNHRLHPFLGDEKLISEFFHLHNNRATSRISTPIGNIEQRSTPLQMKFLSIPCFRSLQNR